MVKQELFDSYPRELLDKLAKDLCCVDDRSDRTGLCSRQLQEFEVKELTEESRKEFDRRILRYAFTFTFKGRLHVITKGGFKNKNFKFRLCVAKEDLVELYTAVKNHPRDWMHTDDNGNLTLLGSTYKKTFGSYIESNVANCKAQDVYKWFDDGDYKTEVKAQVDRMREDREREQRTAAAATERTCEPELVHEPRTLPDTEDEQLPIVSSSESTEAQRTGRTGAPSVVTGAASNQTEFLASLLAGAGQGTGVNITINQYQGDNRHYENTYNGTAAPSSTDGSTAAPSSTDGRNAAPSSTDGNTAAPSSTDGRNAAPSSTDGGDRTPSWVERILEGQELQGKRIVAEQGRQGERILAEQGRVLAEQGRQGERILAEQERQGVQLSEVHKQATTKKPPASASRYNRHANNPEDTSRYQNDVSSPQRKEEPSVPHRSSVREELGPRTKLEYDEITLVFQEKEMETPIAVHPDNKFQGVFDRYNKGQDSFIFKFEGREIDPTQTPSYLGMRDKDVIDVELKKGVRKDAPIELSSDEDDEDEDAPPTEDKTLPPFCCLRDKCKHNRPGHVPHECHATGCKAYIHHLCALEEKLLGQNENHAYCCKEHQISGELKEKELSCENKPKAGSPAGFVHGAAAVAGNDSRLVAATQPTFDVDPKLRSSSNASTPVNMNTNVDSGPVDEVCVSVDREDDGASEGDAKPSGDGDAAGTAGSRKAPAGTATIRCEAKVKGGHRRCKNKFTPKCEGEKFCSLHTPK